MRDILPQELLTLAQNTPTPLYVVGGSVRDYLAGYPQTKPDWDISSPLSAEALAEIAISHGFAVKSIYRHTGTMKLQDKNGVDYEYSCFRSDKYVRGIHTPVETFFTDDIGLDSRRRDFTCNAVYYDIQKELFVDPLQGIRAIQEKRMTTVADADKVFGEDGLRLMRLARQAAQLGFSPDQATLQGAKNNAALIADISPERIFTELLAILSADSKYGVADGAYHGLKLLEETGVLAHILPELTLGKQMQQRTDFHKYDVLEHSLRAVSYATEPVRLAALLHDVGKPYCVLERGNSFGHDEEGARIAKEILHRWKAPKKTVQTVSRLVELHMYDFDCKTGTNKLRRFLVRNHDILEDLLAVKQADFSACKDDLSPAPTVVKWKKIYAQMQAENTPFRLGELAVNGNHLLAVGIPPKYLTEIFQKLLDYTAVCPRDNEKNRLTRIALGFARSIEKDHLE